MSMSFEIYPTKKINLECFDLISISLKMFNCFLENNGIYNNIAVTVQEMNNKGEVDDTPKYMLTDEGKHMAFNINDIGEIYVFYHPITELDIKFWKEEIQINPNARKVKEKIDANLKLGYLWSIKRTMGQPAIVSLYYGYLAIAIAKLTDGIIYSNDGAWDYSSLPIKACDFEKEYLDIGKIKDAQVKENVTKWMVDMKEYSIL